MIFIFSKLNERELKAIQRMTEMRGNSFVGGMYEKKYISILCREKLKYIFGKRAGL